jgi:beta-lactamase class A
MILALLLTASLAAPQVDATIGYSALHLESGRTLSERGGEQFPMGSVYKFPIALEVLRLVDDGTLTLDQKVTVPVAEFAPGWSPLRDAAAGRPVTHSVGDLLQYMLRDSDNTACDVLLRLSGGPASVTRRMREVGIREIRIDRTEAAIARDIDVPEGKANYWIDPRDTATPDAMVRLLVKFLRNEVGLSKASHALAMRHMTETKTGAKRIYSILPEGAVLAHKTGTMPGVANDVGIVKTSDGTHIVIAIFTKGQKESTFAEIEAAIAATAKHALDALTREAQPAAAPGGAGSR